MVDYNLEKNYKQQNPFGTGPWECINKVCPQFGKQVIMTCDIERQKDRRQYKGTWCCPVCGCVYTQNTRNRKLGITDYGFLWEKELLKLYTEQMPLYKISQHMKCSISLVKKKLCKLGCIEDDEAQSNVSGNSLEDYKRTLLNYIQEQPNCTRTELKSKYYRAYKAINLADAAWGEEHLPGSKNKGIKTSKGAELWRKRDLQLSKKIEEIAEEILENNTEVRLCKSLFAKHLEYSGLRESKTLEKLPLCKEVLEKYCEGEKEYNVRRQG